MTTTTETQSHAELIAAELRSKGFPIYALRPNAVLVKFKGRSVSTYELRCALDELLDDEMDNLVTITTFLGVGKVVINA